MVSKEKYNIINCKFIGFSVNIYSLTLDTSATFDSESSATFFEA